MPRRVAACRLLAGLLLTGWVLPAVASEPSATSDGEIGATADHAPASPDEHRDPASSEATPDVPLAEPDSDTSTAQPAAPTSTQKEDDREAAARAAFLRGDRLFLEGDYQGAVEAFQEAYDLSGRLEMLFNLANAHEMLGNYAEAAVALRGYIPYAPPAHREGLRRRLERFERKAREDKARLAAQDAERDRPPAPPTVPVERAAGIGFVSLGAVGVALGTGFALSAHDTRSKLDSQCQAGEVGRLCPEAATPLLDRDQAHSTVADVSFVAGGIAAALGVVLILDSRQHSGGELSARIGPGSLLLTGRF